MNNLNSTFITWLEEWYGNLPSVKLSDVARDPQKTALISEDMVVGFCYKGNLASPQVASIVPNVVNIFKSLYNIGLPNYLLFQDTHDSNASEFSTYPPHCVSGTEESQTIPELKNLPFSDEFIIFEKNSLSSFHGTGFGKWLEEHPNIDTFIVVGDCTDICVYQAAVELRTRGDYVNRKHRVIVPVNCVATYDLPVEVAQKLEAMPHDADFLHKVFLYHMKLNGVDVVREFR